MVVAKSHLYRADIWRDKDKVCLLAMRMGRLPHHGGWGRFSPADARRVAAVLLKQADAAEKYKADSGRP